MITVKISENFFSEKVYILEVIFKQFLGLEYTTCIDNSISFCLIELENSHTIQITDSFFSKLKDNKDEYFSQKKCLPKSILKGNIEELDSLPIVSLFGSLKCEVSQTSIVFDTDIIASSFFMLTRWEEAVMTTRDKNGRFPASESLAVKHDFLHRPIVNEYVAVLTAAIKKLDPTYIPQKKTFNFLLTHDVDLPRLWWNPRDFLKSIGGALLKRKSFKEAFTLTKQYVTGDDPFNVFDWMMTLSERFGFTSHFFFMSGGTSNKDNFYKIDHPVIKKLIATIKDRNHKIGFHPSFNSYNDNIQFTKEVEKLRTVSQSGISSGRHHFLRFEVPTTWQIWEDNGMEWDSTMSFHDREGFRCGVCYPFPVFNIKTKKQLKLIERPLIVMEGSLLTYQKTNPLAMMDKIKALIDTVKKYDGEFVFLWHNSAFRDKKYTKVYEDILNYAQGKIDK